MAQDLEHAMSKRQSGFEGVRPHIGEDYPAKEQYNTTVLYVGKAALGLEPSMGGKRRFVLPMDIIAPIRYVPPVVQ